MILKVGDPKMREDIDQIVARLTVENTRVSWQKLEHWFARRPLKTEEIRIAIENDMGWSEGKPGLWVVLHPGYRCRGKAFGFFSGGCVFMYDEYKITASQWVC